MKVLLFGTGDYYDRYKKWFNCHEVMALLDNSGQKQHTFIDGTEVLDPEEGIRLNYDIIVILSFYVKQMKGQLISLGVDEGRIFHFYDLHQLLAEEKGTRPVHYYLGARKIIENRQVVIPKLLLLSHDLTSGGPEIALFHAAMALKRHGYIVVFASMLDGPLKMKLIENNIPVVVDENLQIATMSETDWVQSFSLIVCNTLNFHVFLSERDTCIPVIWWLHDARFFYDGVNRDVIGKISPDNLKAVSVGPVPMEAVREFLPNLECGELLYGVADLAADETESRESFCVCGQDSRIPADKVCFITIGFLEERKGQDILLHAVQQLPDDIRRGCVFYIVGHDKTLFGEHIHTESSNIKEIVFTGSVDRQEIHQLLAGSDILVCPSRQDPMPTVAAEAMMHSVPCIVSDATGTAACIHDGEDGFVFQSGNVQMLAEKIAWCVANKGKLGGMGEKARKLYEKHFSMEAFEKRFLEVVHGILPSFETDL